MEIERYTREEFTEDLKDLPASKQKALLKPRGMEDPSNALTEAVAHALEEEPDRLDREAERIVQSKGRRVIE